MNKWFILAWTSLPLFVLDVLTKALAMEHLPTSIVIIPNFFQLTYVQNKGAAFGLFAHSDDTFRIAFFTLIPIIALATIFYVFHKLTDKEKDLAVAYSAIFAGAIGNILDRIRFGFVIDFLDFHWHDWHFPAFNVADSAICLGVLWLSSAPYFKKLQS